ncbi:amidohydrolase family protein, partial [candidate division KSB1 bacterium]|nr:amidohydrolase family protein [candidate division KSB1 bacterium]
MRKFKLLTLLLLIPLAFLASNCSQQYDIVIIGGMIYDGSGESPYEANIGIKGGYIVEIGAIDASQGLTTIDAKGLYIAPGFIDVHTHCDRNLTNPDLKSAQNYLMQGVTTVVTGNCGSGTYEVGKYFSTLEEQGIGLNVIHLIGHGRVRSEVIGSADREPTPEELEQMKRLIAKGMEEGAVGLASGLFYAPGSFAKTEEVIELARVVGEFDGIYTSHIRDESNYSTGLKASIEEAIEVGEKAGVPVEISHIKALGKPVWGMAEEICRIIENAQQRGVKVYADQYPYVASSTGLSSAVIPRW